jgi:hypothetical protein
MKKEREIVEVVETGEKPPPMRMRTLQPPPPGTSFTIEEATAALIKVEAEEKARRASRRKRARPAAPVPAFEEEGAPPLRMRTLQPPHPGTSFTIEEAMAALIKVEAEEKARRASRRKRVRSAAKPGPESAKSTDHGKGDDGS